MGGYKFWAVTIILHKKILRLQFLGGYYYATVTITGITVTDTISISLFLTYLILIGDINEVMEKPKYSVIPSLATALILIADEMGMYN